jgi:hypothetical protein
VADARALLGALMQVLDRYERAWLTTRTGYGPVDAVKSEARAFLAQPSPEGLDVERLARKWEKVANAHNGDGSEPCGWCRDRAAQTVEVMARYAAAAGEGEG